mmetsp:Transcript_4325/g.10013  ORF Transcript_4325/g.10013 Transcript_4325/m.10013 type:complete len:256 (+) Transcript_4325:3339-4106(+)
MDHVAEVAANRDEIPILVHHAYIHLGQEGTILNTECIIFQLLLLCKLDLLWIPRHKLEGVCLVIQNLFSCVAPVLRWQCKPELETAFNRHRVDLLQVLEDHIFFGLDRDSNLNVSFLLLQDFWLLEVDNKTLGLYVDSFNQSVAGKLFDDIATGGPVRRPIVIDELFALFLVSESVAQTNFEDRRLADTQSQDFLGTGTTEECYVGQVWLAVRHRHNVLKHLDGERLDLVISARTRDVSQVEFHAVLSSAIQCIF